LKDRPEPVPCDQRGARTGAYRHKRFRSILDELRQLQAAIDDAALPPPD
jgi:hypothetical protein